MFGVLHQGGVIPSLFRVHDLVSGTTASTATQDFRVAYWKTYMPPRHLLAVPQTGMTVGIFVILFGPTNLSDVVSGKITVADYSGSPPETVIMDLQAPSTNSANLSTILVAPFHSIGRLGRENLKCLTERGRVFPHLDLDHIGETLEIGWKEGLSLGIFDVDRSCLNSTVTI